MGGLSALSSLQQTSAANKQAQYQQDVAKANAEAARNQAKITAEKGRIEGENLDRERSALRRQYADLQSGNIASLGALGVDMSSGSALDTLEGNALRFSQDVALNRYQKALSEWETGENVKALEANAANYDAAASYYGSTVKGLGNSLLTAGITGLTSGIGAYAMAGGFGGSSSSGLFGGRKIVSGGGGMSERQFLKNYLSGRR
ncbi:hypothetical protein [Bilophila sp.]|uniref:virion core protein, T7 gp14 family n=1 Tax=Bilophila sp. TaxID=1929485 RepID=UPI003076913E